MKQYAKIVNIDTKQQLTSMNSLEVSLHLFAAEVSDENCVFTVGRVAISLIVSFVISLDDLT